MSMHEYKYRLLFSHLLLDKAGPEANFGPFIGILRQKWRTILPGFINIFKYDQLLSNGFSIVDEYRNLLVDRIILEEQLAFVPQIFFHILIGNAFKFEGHFYPLNIRASPYPM